jgi:ABC-2 type transport system permease protein
MVLVLVAIESVFVFGLALVLSVCNVYFRDVQYLVAIALQVIFYTVPVVYPLRYVPVHATVLGVEIPLLRIYSLNPLVRFVGVFRDVLYNLRFPPIWDLAYIVLWSIGTLVVGLWVFSKLDRRLAEEV